MSDLIKKIVLALAVKKARVWAEENKQATLIPGREETVRWLNSSTVTFNAWSIVANFVLLVFSWLSGEMSHEVFVLQVLWLAQSVAAILARKATAKNAAKLDQLQDAVRKQISVLVAVCCLFAVRSSLPSLSAAEGTQTSATSAVSSSPTAESAGAAAVKGMELTLAPALSPESFGDFITKMGDTVAFPSVFSMVDTGDGLDTGGGLGVHARLLKLRIDATEVSFGPAYVMCFGDRRTWQLAELGFSTRFFDAERAETVFRSIPLVGRLPLHIGRVRLYAGIGSPLDRMLLSASVGVTGIEWGN